MARGQQRRAAGSNDGRHEEDGGAGACATDVLDVQGGAGGVHGVQRAAGGRCAADRAGRAVGGAGAVWQGGGRCGHGSKLLELPAGGGGLRLQGVDVPLLPVLGDAPQLPQGAGGRVLQAG